MSLSTGKICLFLEERSGAWLFIPGLVVHGMEFVFWFLAWPSPIGCCGCGCYELLAISTRHTCLSNLS
jgi:hypothetical protein